MKKARILFSVLVVSLALTAVSCTPESQNDEDTQLTDKDTDRPGNQGGNGNG